MRVQYFHLQRNVALGSEICMAFQCSVLMTASPESYYFFFLTGLGISFKDIYSHFASWIECKKSFSSLSIFTLDLSKAFWELRMLFYPNNSSLAFEQDKNLKITLAKFLPFVAIFDLQDKILLS